MKPSTASRLCRLLLAAVGALGIALPAVPANTDIANEPLSQAASGVQPNIMFILDASGSMAQDYTPDYVNDSQGSGATPSTTAACFDAGDDNDPSTGQITGRPDACAMGDPPFTSPDFNTQYYNPAIRYRPGVNSDGSDMQNQDATNTTNWTAVKTDPFGTQQEDQLNNSKTTENLVTHYPDRVWCLNSGDSVLVSGALNPNCKQNSDYTYPNYQYMFGSNKYLYGSPYYYRMQTAQWCSDAALTTCVSGNAVNASVHLYIAPEFCTDSELTNCAAGAAVTAAHTFSGVRWCSDQNTLLTCQRKKVGNFRWPKHLGVTQAAVATVTAASATGTITVTSVSTGRSITALTIDGIPIVSGAITAGSTSTSALATQIATAITSFASTPEYTATAAGSVVTITAATIGSSENGKAIAIAADSVGTGSATATITVSGNNSNNHAYVEQIQVDDPVSGTINIMATGCTGTYTSVATAAGGLGRRLDATTGLNASSERNDMAAGIRACINQATATNGGYTATVSGNVVTVTAPSSFGSTMNTRTIGVIKSGQNATYSTTNFAGGTSATIATNNSGSLSGGADAVTGSPALRVGYGKFSRVNIVAANNSYTKAATRVDCAGATCTYAEEMTNFSNWYAYYRTRIQMMKSAAGRAFIPIDSTYRVGFITINPNYAIGSGTASSNVQSSRYLKIDNFDTSHKANWYAKFYQQTVAQSTPLREALSRVGRLFAGKFDGINAGIPSADDPVTQSCQPNFAILSTDGYWNGNGGVKLDGTAMTNQDNTDTAPYSKRSDGVYDGAPSSPTVGLADVALYYYKNDLRPTGSKNAAGVDVSADNVPTTQLDFAPHQHMTTFTLGLGLDGFLSYRTDYQTATTGDFFAVKQGTTNWPNPTNDSPQALDDLWHAAVNGRGVFFSASNPAQLANSLSDTLDALKKRVGAGAAAATSNLQPVAGDNFAFTAQYQTQDWIGDLKARTIDLSSGSISAVELWSAQALLNARDHTSRVIYTFDSSDPYDSTSTSDAGNQLKHFCMAAAVGTSPWCNDGSGLTAAEEALLSPTQLSQYPTLHSNTLQDPNVTVENLVNWLRGSSTFEDQGASGPQDLFRARTALLGDIINAQPSYVKSSPFNYLDTGYQDFKKCTQGTTAVTCPAAQFSAPTLPRLPTVYIAANDGMLHAIETDVNNNPFYQDGGISTPSTGDDTFHYGNNTGNGEERWAFIPGMVVSELYQLANNNYNHKYIVDGSPTVGDICTSTPCAGLDDWRTILVAGLNAGGRGFYALDVTNPRKPRAMWEFKVRKPSVTACAATTAAAVGAVDDCDLGLSYAHPVITKLRATGQWVVIVTSGLNNTGYEPGTTLRQGDGHGYVYILDAVSGRIIKKIDTGVGSPGTSGAGYADAVPAGFSHINNWVDNSLVDNTALAVYGADLLGNLWRIDLDNTSATYLTAVKVAELKNGSGQAQPVTTKVELGLISGRRVIFVATGRFLGSSDKSDTTQQSIYAIADDLSGGSTVTDRTPLVEQVISPATSTTRTVTTVNPVDWTNAAVRGWFIDLPDSGERVSVDPQLQLGTLVVASNVPTTDTCVAGGISWINSLDFKTGGYVAGATGNAVSQKISGSVAVGINMIQLPGGKVVTVVTTADNQQLPVDTPIAPSTFSGKRVGWRELTADQ